ncbi:MAG: sugar transferase [Chloroflexi bacterium]|nr:sugar transferase [Chloroflexota bacterium]
MYKRLTTDFMVFMFLCDLSLTLIALPFALFIVTTFTLSPNLPPDVELPTAIYPMVAFVWMVTFSILSVYDPKRVLRFVEEVQLVALASTIAAFVLAGVLYLSYRDVSRYVFLVFLSADLFGLIAYRVAIRAYCRLSAQVRPRETTRMLIVGAGTLGCETARALRAYDWAGLEVIGFVDDDPPEKNVEGLPMLGALSQAPRIVREMNVEEVLVALPLPAQSRLINLVAELQKLPVRIKVIPDFFSLAFVKAQVQTLAGMPVISLREPAISGFPRFVKRLVDLAVSLVGIVLTAPLMLLIAVVVKLDSPGPILFRQQRVGENGKLFWMLKFRTMFVGADTQNEKYTRNSEDAKIVQKSHDDPRVTRVGRLLRRASLDELPQLFNVLAGNMSLVGPRPELPGLVEKYDPWQYQRFVVPQGMTGWWQVNGRSDKPMYLHTEDDLHYVRNYSLWFDLQILWKTIAVVLRGKGAF